MRVRNLLGAFSAFGPGKRRLAAATTMTVIAAAFTLGAAPAASADTSSINFESPTYAVGSIDGQDGWAGTAGDPINTSFDQSVVASSVTGFGSQSFRMSNAATSGGFGDWPFSPSLTNEAGETTATNGGLSGGSRQSHFDAQWSFASTVPGSEQVGLQVSASPDRGDGARMSFIRMKDTTTGLDVQFSEYVDAAPFGSVGTPADGCGVEDNFVTTTVATGLSRTAAHTIKLSMDLFDGQRNDVVRVYVDNTLVKTGTSWEDYYRWCEATNVSRTVDSMLFQARTSGGEAPDTLGYGFLFDNLATTSGPTSTLGVCPVSVTGTSPVVYTLLADCVTDQTIVVPQNTGGSIFNGNSHSITAVDPSAGNFVGAVVQAKDGPNAITVRNLTVTTSNLADVCDGGATRLRGIMFDDVGGTIANNTLTHIKQSGNSGCQEGNAIEARNAPFDTTTPAGVAKNVTISGNAISDYQKTGIVANGSVAATIKNNQVAGQGPAYWIAQNGIQVGYGAKATVTGNNVGGNAYTGARQDDSAGILVVGGPCFGTAFRYTTGLSITKNTLTNNDVGVWLFNARADCSAATIKTNNTVKFNTISSNAVTNVNGNGPGCGYQAGIADVGHRDLIVNNMISGLGYTDVGNCPFLRFIDLDSSARGVPSNK